MRSARSETVQDGCSALKGSASIRKGISTSSTDSGAWCRCSTERAACFITSARGVPGRGCFNCRPVCRLIRITSTSWILSNGAFRCFITTVVRNRETGGSSEEDPVACLLDDRGDYPDDDHGEWFRRGAGER